MHSATPIGADDSVATGDSIRTDTFWKSMGFNFHAESAWCATKPEGFPSMALAAESTDAGRSAGRPVGVRESPLAPGDGHIP